MRVLEELASEALGRGFDTLEVEYKDGWEHVCALKGGIGFGIARFRSSSPEATALRQELYEAVKKPQRMTFNDAEFSLRTRIWDSFGEDAFRVTIRKEPRRQQPDTKDPSRTTRRTRR